MSIDGDLKTHWSIDAGPGRRNQDRKVVFAHENPVGFDGGTILTLQVAQKQDTTISLRGGKPNIGRFRLSVTTAPTPQADPLPASVRRILAVPADQRTREQRREVFRYYRTTVPAGAEAHKAIDELMKAWPYGPTTLALAPRAGPARDAPLQARRLAQAGRGRRRRASPRSCTRSRRTRRRNRLGLARWIVDQKNPLTRARHRQSRLAAVFRAGAGDDAGGFRGALRPPSHPELLDWLAVEFMREWLEHEDRFTG